MRFELNQKYPFICVKFSTHARQCLDGFASSIYEPWEHTLLGVEVRMLTCVEHHKVPSEWDSSESPVLAHDGFILVDDDGVRWANQYPRASYGQISDTADRIVSRMLPDDTDYKAIPDDMVLQMELATYRLERIEGAVHDAQDIISKLESGTDTDKYHPVAVVRERNQLLVDFGKSVKAAIETTSGHEIEIVPLTYGPSKKVLKGHFRAQFVGEETANVL